MKQHHVLDKIVFFLLIIGGLSWGIIGLFGQNILGMIFCMAPGIARLIYILIGLAALYRLILWIRSKMGR